MNGVISHTNDLLTDEGGIISAEPAKRIKEMASIAKEDDELIDLLDNEDLYSYMSSNE